MKNTTNVNTNGGNFHMENSALGINNKVANEAQYNNEIEQEIEEALMIISSAVKQSKNEVADLILQDFKQELSSKGKDKNKLKNYWNALQGTLPSICKLADACAKISMLFAT